MAQYDPRTMRPLARPAARPTQPTQRPAAPVFTSADDALIEAALGMQVPTMQAQGPERYDSAAAVTGKQVLTPQEQATAAKAAAAANAAARKAKYFESIQYLSLLAQSAGIVTEITPPTTGENIDAIYRPLYTNNTNGAVRLQVFADLVNPGVGLVLSLTSDASDVGKVDELALIANGKTESISVVLMPTFSLWVRDRDETFFPMQPNDVVRIRIFDPAKLLAYDKLYPTFM